MTKGDKIILIHFITRTGMYINPVDIHNIQSFITGYEVGRKNKCNFWELSKALLSEKYKIKYLSDGLPGQLRRFSEKQSISRVIGFKKIAIETIALDGFDIEIQKVLKSSITDLIRKIDKAGHPWYNETWKDSWISFVSINNKWFRQLWSKEEFAILKLMDKEVLTGKIFNGLQNKFPSANMLYLKEKFDKINFA